MNDDHFPLHRLLQSQRRFILPLIGAVQQKDRQVLMRIWPTHNVIRRGELFRRLILRSAELSLRRWGAGEAERERQQSDSFYQNLSLHFYLLKKVGCGQWTVVSEEIISCPLPTAHFLRLFDYEPRGGDHYSRLRVVVVVERRRGRLRLHAVARLELERKLQAARLRPQISDHAVRQEVVMVQTPARFLRRPFERFAVDICARRQPYLREHHPELLAITLMPDAFGCNVACDLFADLRFELVVVHCQSQRARIAEPEVFAPLGRALLPRLGMRLDNLRRRSGRIARAPDFNAVVSPAEER